MATVLVKALLFKLDDVLSSEIRLEEGLYHQVARKLSRRPGGPSRRALLLPLLAYQEEGLESRAWSLLFHDVAALRQTIRYTDLLQLVKKTLPVGVPFQGIPELARALDEQGVRTAVMAGPYCPHQRNKVKALRLDCLFGPIVYTDFFTRNPRRAVYQAIEKLAAQWKDLAPRDIAYIADNPAVDFPAARLAGLHTLRLRLHKTRHEFDEPRSAKERPEREFTSVHELIGALCRYFHIEPGQVLPGEWDYYLKPRPWRLMNLRRNLPC